jgi:hypothetical protein
MAEDRDSHLSKSCHSCYRGKNMLLIQHSNYDLLCHLLSFSAVNTHASCQRQLHQFSCVLEQLELTLKGYYIACFVYVVTSRVVRVTKITGSSSDDWIC